MSADTYFNLVILFLIKIVMKKKRCGVQGRIELVQLTANKATSSSYLKLACTFLHFACLQSQQYRSPD